MLWGGRTEGGIGHLQEGMVRRDSIAVPDALGFKKILQRGLRTQTKTYKDHAMKNATSSALTRLVLRLWYLTLNAYRLFSPPFNHLPIALSCQLHVHYHVHYHAHYHANFHVNFHVNSYVKNHRHFPLVISDDFSRNAKL